MNNLYLIYCVSFFYQFKEASKLCSLHMTFHSRVFFNEFRDWCMSHGAVILLLFISAACYPLKDQVSYLAHFNVRVGSHGVNVISLSWFSLKNWVYDLRNFDCTNHCKFIVVEVKIWNDNLFWFFQLSLETWEKLLDWSNSY